MTDPISAATGDVNDALNRLGPPPRSPRDHAFVRSADPNFGSFFGGACAEDVDGVTCGWPESVHPAQPRPEPDDQADEERTR